MCMAQRIACRICRKLQARLATAAPPQQLALGASPTFGVDMMASPSGALMAMGEPAIGHRQRSGHRRPLQPTSRPNGMAGGHQRAAYPEHPRTPSDLAITELSGPSDLSGLPLASHGPGSGKKAAGKLNIGPGRTGARGSLADLLKAKYSGQ